MNNVESYEYYTVWSDDLKMNLYFYVPPNAETYDTTPLPRQREVVTPGAGGVEIPVDKTKYRIKFVGETENRVDVIIEPKDSALAVTPDPED